MILKFIQNGNAKQVKENYLNKRHVYTFAKQVIPNFDTDSSCYTLADFDIVHIHPNKATTFRLELIYENHISSDDIPF